VFVSVLMQFVHVKLKFTLIVATKSKSRANRSLLVRQSFVFMIKVF
jgi:hypothetical protein